MADRPSTAPGDTGAAPDASVAALARLLEPLARLAVAKGLTHAVIDEMLRRALVDAADRVHAALPPHRRVSRVATTTGIHRREVTRQIEALRAAEGALPPPASRSPAAEVFAHWRTDPLYCDRRGTPLELPRHGAAPSFETLAQGVTRDVHPRSLLDELVRLGVAAHDADRDSVRLLREAFVPAADKARMLQVLAANVGSHFDAAVDNVLADGRVHFEQALFAGGLTGASITEVRGLIHDQWQALLAAMVPALEAMVERDRAAPAGPRQRLRLGLYSHIRDEAPPPPPAST